MNLKTENPTKPNSTKIPESIYKRAKEKETLEWLFENAAVYEKKYNLPEGVLLALAGHESAHYQKSVASGTGPKGLFQISIGTGKAYGMKIGNGIDERLDLARSTDVAAKLLSDNLKEQKGDLLKALAQYNGGGKAANYVDGRAHLYNSKNGNPGELYGFLRGVANYAKEWGKENIYNTLLPAYQERSDELKNRKAQLKAKGYDVEVNDFWGNKEEKLWNEAIAKNPTLDPNYKGPKTTIQSTSDQFSKRVFSEINFKKEKPENYVVKNPTDSSDEIKDSPKPVKSEQKKVTVSEGKRDPKQVRVFEFGGKMVQKAEGTPDVPLQGEERIYSIPDTKKMIAMAKAAKSENSLITLGKFIYKATKKQIKRSLDEADV